MRLQRPAQGKTREALIVPWGKVGAAPRHDTPRERGPLFVASLMEKKRDRCVWQKQRPLQRTAERLGTGGVSAAPRGKPVIGLHHSLKRWSVKRNDGFGGPASVTEVAVNFKIGVQRVGLNLCKSGLGAAYRARVSWL